MKQFLCTLAASTFLVMLLALPGQAADPENTLYLDLEHGRVVIEMRPDLAPQHVKRIKELCRIKFYDGLTFHRVIPGFMAQTGDPRGDGTGGSGKNIPAEFNQGAFTRGAVGMARSMNPNSADSQFFICYAPASHLNGKYTYWGQVVEGMQFVDRIRKGRGANGMVRTNPDIIVRMRVAADVE